MDVAIVHFNTPELTAAAVRSVWKHSPGCRVTVFDNSDRRPFRPMEGVFVLNNTRGKLIDFKKMLDEYPDRPALTMNDWGSAKHCKTIDYLWDVFPSGFVLMDADALLKRDVRDLEDYGRAFSGEVFQDLRYCETLVPRVLPYLCWFNVPMLRKAGIRYFDGKRNWKLYPGDFTTWYDTGGSFYEDCANKRLRWNHIMVGDYIEHLRGGSYNPQETEEAWLEKHKDLYE